MESSQKCPNWLELPRDATLTILMKLTTSEILESAQFVCKMWYNVCKEPSMWHTIHMIEHDPKMLIKQKKMLVNAVDRSDGGLNDLDIEGFGSDVLLSYVLSRSMKLERLRLADCCGISAKAVTEALEKLSSLKELELTVCFFQEGKETISIIKSCPLLTTFKFNNVCSYRSHGASDEEAVAIAGSMPEIHHLQLIGNNMTNVGLLAILDGCPKLKSLDLRACFHLKLKGNIGKRLLQQIKVLKCPNDSTYGYNYPTYEEDENEYMSCNDYVSDADYEMGTYFY